MSIVTCMSNSNVWSFLGHLKFLFLRILIWSTHKPRYQIQCILLAVSKICFDGYVSWNIKRHRQLNFCIKTPTYQLGHRMCFGWVNSYIITSRTDISFLWYGAHFLFVIIYIKTYKQDTCQSAEKCSDCSLFVH